MSSAHGANISMNPENQPRFASKYTSSGTPELFAGSSCVTSLSKESNLRNGYAPSVGFISLDSDPKLIFRFRYPKNFQCKQQKYEEKPKHQNVPRGASSKRSPSASRTYNPSQKYVMGLTHGTTGSRKQKHYPGIHSPKKLRVSPKIIEPNHQPKPTEIPPVPTCSLTETVCKGSSANSKTNTRIEANASEEKFSTKDPRLAKLRVRQDLMASDESTKHSLSSSLYMTIKSEVEDNMTQSVVDFVKTETFFEEDPMPEVKQEQYWF